MKNIILLLATLLTQSINVVAQNCTTGGSPWCTDGNTILSTDALGGDGSNTNPLNIQTAGVTRMTILGATNPGFVGIGITTPTNLVTISDNGTTGFGPVQQSPELLVVGSNAIQATPEPIVAEFRSHESSTSSSGIKIRGARNVATASNCAFINFSNWDDGFGGSRTPTEYLLARISADQRTFTGPANNLRGYLRIFTTDGTGTHGNVMIDDNGFTGIGFNFFNSSTAPDRRLEVFDNANAQLRLTYTHATGVAATVYTDFQTTAAGNLFINPVSAAGNRSVGINTSNPGKTLEINTNNTPVSPVNGNSGLRFSDLTTASVPIANPFGTANPAVLSVNPAGDVVLVQDVFGVGSVVCTPGFYVQKSNAAGTTLACSQIYDNGINVGVKTTNPLEGLHNAGSSRFEIVTNPSVLTPQGVYPLAAVSYNFATGKQRAIGVFDDLHTEALNIANVRGPGFSTNIIEAIGGVTNIAFGFNLNTTPNPWNNAVMGIHRSGTIYMKRSVLGNTGIMTPDLSTGDISRLLVEEDDVNNSMTTAIVGRNIESNNGNSTGVFGQSNGAKTNINFENRGGEFIGQGADRSFGILCRSNGVFTSPNQNRLNLGSYFEANNGDSNFGGMFSAGLLQNAATVSANYGVHTTAAQPTTLTSNYNYGVWSSATYASVENYGGRFSAQGPSTSRSFGVFGEANNSNENYGGHFEAINGSGTNPIIYGVYASGPSSACNPSSNPCAQAAGFFNGDLVCFQDFVISDSTIKDNIVALQALDTSIINSVTGYSFTFDQAGYPSMNLPSGTHIGFIADQIQAVFPGMVKSFTQPAVYDSLGNVIHPAVEFSAVSYKEFIPIIWNQMKHQQTQIDSLQQQIAACCTLATKTQNPFNTGSIELQNVKTLQLFAADPNPFSESTWVRWSITEDFQNAIIYFYDNNGNQINTYKISEKGNGELQIFGSTLSSGVYTYTLVVDGKAIDSKKMMKAK